MAHTTHVRAVALGHFHKFSWMSLPEALRSGACGLSLTVALWRALSMSRPQDSKGAIDVLLLQLKQQFLLFCWFSLLMNFMHLVGSPNRGLENGSSHGYCRFYSVLNCKWAGWRNIAPSFHQTHCTVSNSRIRAPI